MTHEELRKKVAPIIIRRTLTQAAMLARSAEAPSTPREPQPRDLPAQMELPLPDNIVLGTD
jgi:hypothetical protein